MVEVEFKYKGKNLIYKCNKEDKLKDIFKKFKKYAEIDDDNLNIHYFYGENEIINDEFLIEEIANYFDKKKSKIIIKVEIERDEKEEVNYKNIICPECKEKIKMEIKNYKINLFDCKNNHKKDNILFDELKESQKVNILDKTCDICKKKNKDMSDNNQKFVKCLTCNKYICPLCKSYHDLTHDLINYEDTFYLCDKHNKYYNSYCKECKLNLCELCEHDLKHKKINFVDILPKRDLITQEKIKLKKLVHLFTNDINMIISMLNEVKDKINIYDRLNSDILNNYNEKITNYETLYYLNKFPDKIIIEDLERIVRSNTVIDKFYGIFTIYKQMNNDEITLIYDTRDKKEIRIFNKDFIHNYKKFCKLIIEGKEKDLKDTYTFGKIFATKKDTFEVKLKGITNITNMNSMFHSCYDLKSIPDLNKWNTTTITNMSNLFYDCERLTSLPDLSKWNSSNVMDMSYLFYNCFSVTEFPDISKWDTSNVVDMSYMFYNCSSLSSFPNTHKWNISNVQFMDNMFNECHFENDIPSKFRQN